jgi:hypothetical protein
VEKGDVRRIKHHRNDFTLTASSLTLASLQMLVYLLNLRAVMGCLPLKPS